MPLESLSIEICEGAVPFMRFATAIYVSLDLDISDFTSEVFKSASRRK